MIEKNFQSKLKARKIELQNQFNKKKEACIELEKLRDKTIAQLQTELNDLAATNERFKEVSELLKLDDERNKITPNKLKEKE